MLHREEDSLCYNCRHPPLLYVFLCFHCTYTGTPNTKRKDVQHIDDDDHLKFAPIKLNTHKTF